jgi:hypothetical protein
VNFASPTLSARATTQRIDIQALRGLAVLSSPFFQYLHETAEGLQWGVVTRTDGRETAVAPNVDTAVAGLNETIRAVRKLGKKVVIAAPPPSSSMNIGDCLERQAFRRLLFNAHIDCRIPVQTYRQFGSRVFDMLERTSKESGVNVVTFDEVLCDGQYCATSIDGTFIYLDGRHFTYGGSVLVAKRMNLAQRITAEAR